MKRERERDGEREGKGTRKKERRILAQHILYQKRERERYRSFVKDNQI